MDVMAAYGLCPLICDEERDVPVMLVKEMRPGGDEDCQILTQSPIEFSSCSTNTRSFL